MLSFSRLRGVSYQAWTAALKSSAIASPPAKEDLSAVDAAVTIPIITVNGETPSIVICLRHAVNSRHAGQMGFPGGFRSRNESESEECSVAALRELNEEIGVGAEHSVEILNELPVHRTFGTKVSVKPYIVTFDHERVAQRGYVRQESEVDDIVIVDIATLLDVYNPSDKVLEPRSGLRFRTPTFRVPRARAIVEPSASTNEEYCIWGLSARMMERMFELTAHSLAE